MDSLDREVAAGRTVAAYLRECGHEGDTDLLADSIEGQTNFAEVAEAVITSALEDEAMVRALEGQIEEMQERVRRMDKRADKKREAVLKAMQDTGLNKMERPRFTLSIRAGSPKVIITEEAAVPDSLCRITRAPDKKAIRELLDTGAALSFATLSNGEPSLSVRTK